MKFIKWRTLIITSIVCLLPILMGVAFWEQLPDKMAIHFDVNNNPDNFASKGFTVFALPCIMVLLQAFCCFINDLNAKKHGERAKFERAIKWIIPVITVILQVVTIGYSLGWSIDIRRVAAFIVGWIFLVIGNYLPKLDYIKNYDVDTEKARKINRFIGYASVVMGICYIASIFLPPVATVCCILLLIPYGVIAVVYSVKVAKK